MGQRVGVNASAIPQWLRDYPRWALWRVYERTDGAKPAKVPVTPTGIKLSTAKPEKWFEWSTIEPVAGKYDGIGFCLTGLTRITVVDFDRCLDADGLPLPEIRPFVESLPRDAFVEVSPSGTGLHVWLPAVRAAEDIGRAALGAVGVEIYAGYSPRYVSVTGQIPAWARHDKALDADSWLAELLAALHRGAGDSAPAPAATPVPDDLPEPPQVDTSGWPSELQEFCAVGKPDPIFDGSAAAHRIALLLARGGLTPEQRLAWLLVQPGIVEWAESKRRSFKRGQEYLWTHYANAPAVNSVRISADDFADLAEDTPPIAPPAPAARERKSRFRVLTAEQFAQADWLRLEWIVDGLVPKAGRENPVLMSIYGQPACGKSYLVLDLLHAVAVGRQWFGFSVEAVPTCYLPLEGRAGARERIDTLLQHKGPAPQFHVLHGDFDLLTDQAVNDLANALRELGPTGICAIDTLAAATPGLDENSGKDMGAVIKRLTELSRRTGWAVLIIAHSGKDESRGIRGWSGTLGALDLAIEVERNADCSRWRVVKSKDGDYSGAETFAVVRQEFGAGIVIEAESDRAFVKPRGKLQTLVVGIWESIASITEPPTEMELIALAANRLPPPAEGGRDKRREHVKRALNTLLQTGALRLIDGRVHRGG